VLHTQVVGKPETQILWGLDKPDLGVKLAQHLAAAVEGSRVHHDDLVKYAAGMGYDGGDALTKIILGIPVDNDDGDVRFRCHGFLREDRLQ
jgi:hypothetical protein